MKKTLALVALTATCAASEAQYAIPDPAFAAKLQQIVPNAMSGNVLDTTHADVLTLNDMAVNNAGISDLDGIQYFAALTSLKCHYNSLTSLPDLPENLEVLWCFVNNLSALPSLPPSLQWLDCKSNPLGALPTLPASLEQLTCDQNGLTSLPPLPSSLEKLYCRDNDLTSLPTLPASLRDLRCYNNQLTALPALPQLNFLYCGNNPMQSLPPLPTSLGTLHCMPNSLTGLPASLPPLLSSLAIGQNPLITSLPPHNDQLLELFAQETSISSLPPLSANLEKLHISLTNITCLPSLPNTLNRLYCENTGVTCLPNFPTSLDTANSELGFEAVDCNVNSAPCPLADEAITGSVFLDDDGDGIMDPGEAPFVNAVVEAQPGDLLTAPDLNGNYVLRADSATFTLDGMPVLYHMKTTPAVVVSLGPLEIDSLNDIGYQPIPGIYDLVVDIQAEGARPGFTNNLYLHVHNIGTEATTATIDLAFDIDQSWVGSTETPDLQLGNNASWTTLMEPGDAWHVQATLYTALSVPLGTPLDHTLNAVPQQPDSTMANNTASSNTVVVGSFDPNDKRVEPTEISLFEVQAGEFVEYTIRFQNTGTAPALRVVITDTLSTDLEWASMEYVSGSHDNTWYLHNGALHFTHDPIFLPDSTSNEPDSHGYVKFRMRPQSSLMVAESIENVANIHFDFNEPVITEPAVFEVALPTTISPVAHAGVQLFPNPSNGRVTIISDDTIERIEVLQLDGRLLRSSSANSKRIDLDLSELVAGLYVVSLYSGTDRVRSELLMRD
ncbi:MAG: DUF11 domain-containing protein [Flavobacteriales bacterium]|nr:DUF11 domain-containing protein [Flavobacteriales bacterium]